MILSDLSFEYVFNLMKLAFGIFSFELVGMFFVLLFKRIKKKNVFDSLNESLKLNFMQFYSSLFSLLTIVVLYFLYDNYFGDLDGILSSLLIMAGLIAFNIIIKIINIFIKFDAKNSKFIISLFLKSMDNFLMMVILTQTCAILASQITTVDITRYFGVDIKRSTLINLPFFISVIFLLLSNIGLLLKSFVIKKSNKFQIYFNDFYQIFTFILSSFICVYLFSISYNIFLVMMIGILTSYIIMKVSTYLNKKQLVNRKKMPVLLPYLYNISNVVSSSFWVGIIMLASISIAITFGKFYGLGLICLSMVGGCFFLIFDNVNENYSESFKYVAKTINNIVLFYIFFETLEFLLKHKVNINIFSVNVILGFILSMVLVLFNILKIVNLVKFIQINNKKFYLFFRSLLYIVLFSICLYLLYPYIDYEVLSSFIFGLIFITSFISIIGLNLIDVLENKAKQNVEIFSIFKNSVLPIVNHITTLLIIIVILFIIYY